MDIGQKRKMNGLCESGEMVPGGLGHLEVVVACLVDTVFAKGHSSTAARERKTRRAEITRWIAGLLGSTSTRKLLFWIQGSFQFVMWWI